MKPQIGQSKLAILNHAPNVHRKRRPIDLRSPQASRSHDSNSFGNVEKGFLRRTAPGPGSHPHHLYPQHPLAHTHHSSHPPSLLRRQTTRAKSFMDLDLPSLRALRREPSMMELDPPSTLFNPAPKPSHFAPGPWAFFQAAEAHRQQRQNQIEFLTRLQELRVRDEQLFLQVMAGFAKECPVQFAQLTSFMRRMEMEMEMEIQQQQQQQQQQMYFQQHHQQHQFNLFPQQQLHSKRTHDRNHNASKTGLLSLAQMFGNQVYHGQFQRQQQQQQQQLFQGFDQRNGRQNRGRGRSGRGGFGHGAGGSVPNGGNLHPAVPSLRRGKTFQQQQQVLQQLTAYQRHLYEQVQQMHRQKQQQAWPRSPLGQDVTGAAIPMAHELMQYAAMLAGEGNMNAIPPLLVGSASPTSSINSGPVTPISPVGLGDLMVQLQHQQHPGVYQHPQLQLQQQQLQQQQHLQQKDPLELAAINMQLNMGSSRRSRYKPPPLRMH